MTYRSGAAISLCAVIALTWGCGAKDQGKDYLLRHAGVTLAQAAAIAEAQIPGRAVKVELITKGRQVVYEVEVIDTVNESRKVVLDAETGKPVK